MPEINWNLLSANGPAEISNKFLASFEQGRKIGDDLRKRKALSAFAADPQNPQALSALMEVAPELGFKAAEYQREQAKAQREQEFSGALSEYMTSGGGNALLGLGGRQALPGPPDSGTPNRGVLSGFAPNAGANALLGPPQAGPAQAGALSTNALAPFASQQGSWQSPADALELPDSGEEQAPGPDVSWLGTPKSGADHAFLRMVRVDPLKALKIRSELRDNLVKGLKDTRDLHDLAYERLGETTDESSYQRALAELAPMVAAVGGNLTDHVPPNYPGPEGIQQLLRKALTARQQVSAFMQQANIDEDNERGDRNTDSLIADREARRDIQRRGQDIRSRDTRRGQNLRGSGSGRGGSGGGGGGAVAGPVRVNSVEEAMKLPSGTRFRTPDNRVKVRP